MKKNFIFLIFILLISTSCASIVSKSVYTVVITSTPHADITIKDRNGKEIFKGHTPTAIYLRASAGYFKRGIYTVAFSKESYKNQLLTIESRIKGWYVVGNLIFGVFGGLGWFVVDPLTGAMYKIDQKVYNAVLQKDAIDNTRALKILSMDEVPEELRPRLIIVK